MEYARSTTHLSNQLFHPKDFLVESLGMTAQPPSPDGTFVQITLEGVGFDGAKIPLDSSEELVRKDLEELIDRVTRGAQDPVNLPDYADEDSFWELGKSLYDGGIMRIIRILSGSSSPTTVTLSIQRHLSEPLKRESKGQPTESFQLLEGKVTGLNLTKKRFQFENDKLGELHGSYTSPVMPADLIELLGDSANAETSPQPALILGRFSFNKERLGAVVETTFVASSKDTFVPAAKKLASLSELEDGWLNEGSPRPQPKTLALAGAVLSVIRKAGLPPPPGIFPTEEGGVLFEWATADYVFSIEVESDNHIVAYALYPQQRQGHSVEGDSPAFLTRIIETWVPVING